MMLVLSCRAVRFFISLWGTDSCYLKTGKKGCFLFSGGWQDETWPDGWTAVTRDGKRSAQFEHTLLVTDTGCEILTRRLDSIRPHFMNQ